MDAQAGSVITVEVACATPQQQIVLTVEAPLGATLREIVQSCGIGREFADIDMSTAPIGVWGEVASGQSVATAGDRIEIYRPLQNDPRALRMQLASQGRTMGRGSSDS